MKVGVLALHGQRFWPPSRIAGLKDLPDPVGEYLDLAVGTEVNVQRAEGGQYLCELNGYYKWVDASWVNAVCPGVVCKCPTARCPRHGRLRVRGLNPERSKP